jgi:hypothetical protein
MNSTEFNELAGRIEGLADFVLHLAAQLEINNLIDGPRLTDVVRDRANVRRFPPESDASLDAYRRTLQHLADRLDEAREGRDFGR